MSFCAPILYNIEYSLLMDDKTCHEKGVSCSPVGPRCDFTVFHPNHNCMLFYLRATMPNNQPVSTLNIHN